MVVLTNQLHKMSLQNKHLRALINRPTESFKKQNFDELFKNQAFWEFLKLLILRPFLKEKHNSFPSTDALFGSSFNV